MDMRGDERVKIKIHNVQCKGQFFDFFILGVDYDFALVVKNS